MCTYLQVIKETQCTILFWCMYISLCTIGCDHPFLWSCLYPCVYALTDLGSIPRTRCIYKMCILIILMFVFRKPHVQVIALLQHHPGPLCRYSTRTCIIIHCTIGYCMRFYLHVNVDVHLHVHCLPKWKDICVITHVGCEYAHS